MNFKRLAGNAIIAFAAQAVALVASLCMSLLVPKVLGVEAFGYWQLFVFYASYGGFFHFGLNDGVYLIEGGKTRSEIDKVLINSQFRVAVAIQIIVGFALVIPSLVFGEGYERGFVLLAFALYTVLLNLSAYFGYVFQAMNETKLFSFMTMLERLAFLVPMIAMVTLGVSTFEPFVVAYLAARFLALAYSCWKARDIISAGHYPASRSIKTAISSIKVGFSLMAANIASMLILGVMRMMVDSAWGIEAFGRVSFALSMVNFFITFVSQASMVLFPALRQGTEGERQSFYRGIRDAMEIMFPAVYLLFFPMAWLLVVWLPQYSDSMRYFALLLPVCVFDAKMDICGTTYFKVLREERTLLKVNVVTVLASAVLSFAGVYLLGSIDAALLGAVLAIIGRSLWSEWYLNRRLSIPASMIPLEEIILTVVFALLALFVQPVAAFTSYAVAYAIYLLANRETTLGLFHSVRHALKK